jgi:hypothetical protein
MFCLIIYNQKSNPNDFSAFLAFKFPVDINEYDIISDTPDAFPWDDNIIFSPKYTEKPARPRYDNRQEAACDCVDNDVTNKPQAKTITYVDNFFAAEIRDPAIHCKTSLQ